MTSETRRRPLHYQFLRSLGPASIKRLAGTSATTRASSPCRHLFVVLGTIFECSKSIRRSKDLHNIFIVCSLFRRVIIGYIEGALVRSLPIQ
ncbi:unnamed protein product [Penicillium camemberti]|uniref:Str. FM013 n=1 Tax=Penicillium camemberti (strain FM 013) TaxID=1429867 RepID=A0A0G4PYP4_PENC3|nr:unnamed protein product [Penicillium camemberti]